MDQPKDLFGPCREREGVSSMNIFVSGLNYRTAPLEIREKLSFSAEEQKNTLMRIAALPQVSEGVILSTCNRTEIYVYFEANSPGGVITSAMIENELCRYKGLPALEYRKYFYSYQGIGAVQHLFRVTVGLDSMVVGEDQILGQVKKAHQAALDAGTSRTCLNTLFREAVTAAKLIKNALRLSKMPRSVASLAIKEIRRRLSKDLSGKTVLLIGTGEVGSLILANLADTGVKKILLASRNKGKNAGHLGGIPARFQPLQYPVEIIDYQLRYDCMNEADLIFSATASPHYTITRDQLEKSLQSAKKRIFIDLAVPRDIDKDIRELSGVEYLNLDDLAKNAGADWNLSMLEGIKAEGIINEHVLSFERWYQFRNVLPLMREIQHVSSGYVEVKINEALVKLQSASDSEKEVVRNAMQNLANHFLNQYLYAVKENVSWEEANAYLKCLGKSMGMSETDQKLWERDGSGSQADWAPRVRPAMEDCKVLHQTVK
ncbi:MAG TPA: glutamyl-tRNA reductase [Firmicutes bacterium]|jgi:glutamyl-tRNA reductase|nr:glutamyl-tRNA reductase [Bacillota bacterium]